MSLNNEQITNNILESITTLVQAEISKISYDRTLIFTISDDSNKDDGYYIVTDGEKSFKAFSQEEYKVEDKVYVTIPDGDYENHKIIVSKYISEEDIANNMVSYIPPDRQVIEIEKYIINDDFSIIATGDGNYSETKVAWFDWGLRQIDNSFTSLLLRGKFKTSFGTEILSGNYGVRAVFITAPGGLLKSDGNNFINFEGFTEITTLSQLEQKIAEYNANLGEDQQEYELMFNTSIMELSSKSMTGNIYNSSLTQEQAISFDISNYKNIVGCYICFFQDGDFKYQNLNGIENLITSDKSNLSLTNLSISFGYQEKDYEKEKDALEISTTDTLTYFPSTISNEINAKDIKIRWIHWDEEEKKHVYIRDSGSLGSTETEGLGTNLNHSLIIGPEEFGQGVEFNEVKYYNLSDDTKYELYWYEEKVGAIGDGLSGFHWTPIKITPYWNRQEYSENMTKCPELATSRELQKERYNGPVLSWIQQQKEKDKSVKIQEETTLNRFSQLFNFVYCPITQNSSISLKAILVSRKLLEGQEQYEDKVEIARSESLIFYNEQEIKQIEPGQIILTVEDAVKEFYIYGENGQLENSNYDNQVFTIKANLPFFDETETFDDFSITWNLPLVNSMLDNILPIDTLGHKGDGTISSQNKDITVQQVLQYGYNFFKYYPNSETWSDIEYPDQTSIKTYFNNEEKLQAFIDYYGDTLSITYMIQRKSDEEFKDYLNRCQNFCYQSFSIKNYFNASSSNNSIGCTILIGVNNKKLWGEKTLVFGQNFSSGTQYNFNIFYKNETDQGFYKLPGGEFNNIKIVPQLHGKGINLSEDDRKEWLSTVQIAGTNEADSTFFNLISADWEDNEYVWTFGLKLINDLPIDSFNEILKATITVNGTTLSAYLAVPINNFPWRYQGISAPTVINYSSQGGRLNYNKDGLKLFKVPATSGEENGVVHSFDIVEKPYSQASWNSFPTAYNDGVKNSRITIEKDNSQQYMYIKFVPNITLNNGDDLSPGTYYYLGVKSKDVDYKFKYIGYDSDNDKVITQELSQTIQFNPNYTFTYDYLIRDKPYGKITKKIALGKNTSNAYINTYKNSNNKNNIIERETDQDWYTLSKVYEEGDQFCYSSSSDISISGGTVVTINKKIYRNNTYYYELDTSIPDGNYYLRSVYSIPKKWRNNERIIVEDTDFNAYPLINAENTVGLRWIKENEYKIEIFNDINKNHINSLIEQLQTWKTNNPLTTPYSDENLEYKNYCYLALTDITKEWKYYYFNYSINSDINSENNGIYLTFIGQNGAILDDILDFRDFDTGAKEAYLYYLYFPEYEVKQYTASIGALEEKNVFWALNTTEITDNSYNFNIFDIVGKHEDLIKEVKGNKLELDRTNLNKFKFATSPETREYISMQGYPYFSGEIINGDTDDWWCQWYLNPYHIYTSGQKQISLICYTLQEAGLTPVWVQPLIIKQNLYEVEIVNGWDGQTKIDNNYILSEAIGAGSKNDNNEFSGVLMGKMENSIDDEGAQHGLYGFHKGAQCFGFKENGKAFIGTSGAGRIEFDGTKSTIQSGNYSDDDKTGMKIDLSNGKITGYNANLQFKNGDNKKQIVTISSDSENYPINVANKFKVDWEGNLKANDAELRNTTFTGTMGGWTVNETEIWSSTDQGEVNNLYDSMFPGYKYKDIYHDDIVALLNTTEIAYSQGLKGCNSKKMFGDIISSDITITRKIVGEGNAFESLEAFQIWCCARCIGGNEMDESELPDQPNVYNYGKFIDQAKKGDNYIEHPRMFKPSFLRKYFYESKLSGNKTHSQIKNDTDLKNAFTIQMAFLLGFTPAVLCGYDPNTKTDNGITEDRPVVLKSSGYFKLSNELVGKNQVLTFHPGANMIFRAGPLKVFTKTTSKYSSGIRFDDPANPNNYIIINLTGFKRHQGDKDMYISWEQLYDATHH